MQVPKLTYSSLALLALMLSSCKSINVYTYEPRIKQQYVRVLDNIECAQIHTLDKVYDKTKSYWTPNNYRGVTYNSTQEYNSHPKNPLHWGDLSKTRWKFNRYDENDKVKGEYTDLGSYTLKRCIELHDFHTRNDFNNYLNTGYWKVKYEAKDKYVGHDMPHQYIGGLFSETPRLEDGKFFDAMYAVWCTGTTYLVEYIEDYDKKIIGVKTVPFWVSEEREEERKEETPHRNNAQNEFQTNKKSLREMLDEVSSFESDQSDLSNYEYPEELDQTPEVFQEGNKSPNISFLDSLKAILMSWRGWI